MVSTIIKKIRTMRNTEINCMTNILSCFSALEGFLIKKESPEVLYEKRCF